MENPLIIRVSKINRSLILAMNQENVYRVFLNGIESFNGLEYEEASNYFNEVEENIYK